MHFTNVCPAEVKQHINTLEQTCLELFTVFCRLQHRLVPFPNVVYISQSFYSLDRSRVLEDRKNKNKKSCPRDKNYSAETDKFISSAD